MVFQIIEDEVSKRRGIVDGYKYKKTHFNIQIGSYLSNSYNPRNTREGSVSTGSAFHYSVKDT